MTSNIKDVMVKLSLDTSKATKAFEDFGDAIKLINELKDGYNNHVNGKSILLPIIEEEVEITDPVIDRFEDILKEE